ncbi:MAG: DUF2950 domain-containing protein [Deltaproteobacteria bacterium]|nr:DUF2950 domain-containing protein [Deltaproteobacteria bacterium]
MMILMRMRIINVIKMAAFSIIAAAALIVLCGGAAEAAKMTQKTFASPEEAFGMLIASVESKDAKQLNALFGRGSEEIFPADGEDDAGSREGFLEAYRVKHRLEKTGTNKVILHVGEKDWPWPVPLTKAGSRWRFDTRAGIKEIVARRIGKNEVAAVQVCLAYVDAQLEYASQHGAAGIGEYAQRLASEPGKKNGLCCPAQSGEKPSLLGPLVASACEEEMTSLRLPGKEPAPYHGYYYKILKSQGKDAPGGAYDYIVDKKMIGGFALVAYPAVYGVTGITTFIVNKDDMVYQKDLGRNSKKIARAMTSYNPDATWKKVDE